MIWRKKREKVWRNKEEGLNKLKKKVWRKKVS